MELIETSSHRKKAMAALDAAGSLIEMMPVGPFASDEEKVELAQVLVLIAIAEALLDANAH